MWLPHGVLITIYWNQARPVRLPLPIIPGVNATAHRFGGFGFRPGSYKVTARQGGWHRVGHLEIGPTDHFEGILASHLAGQSRAEMAWTYQRSHLSSALTTFAGEF